MTKNLDLIKKQLIKKISAAASRDDFAEIKQLLDLLLNSEKNLNTFQDIQKEITVEQLIEEQSYKFTQRKKIDLIARKMNIKESFEDLLMFTD